MELLKQAKLNEQDLVKDLQGLLAIDSVIAEDLENKEAPFGLGIRHSLDYILDLGKKFGFKIKNIDNVAGHIEFGEGEEIIGVLCHVDVVPAVGEWTNPPFSPTIKDGKIFARGAVDDKGPAISALYAMKILKDLNVKLNKRIRLIIGTDEETKWRCMAAYFKSEQMPNIGFSPDASFPVIYGEKGIMSIDLLTNELSNLKFKSGVAYNVVPDEAVVRMNEDLSAEFKKYLKDNNFKGEANDGLKLYGQSAHAMQPEKGVNAAINLAKFLLPHTNNKLISFMATKLTNTRFKDLSLDFSDKVMKDLTVNVAVIDIDEHSGKVGLNLRYPINWDKEGFIKKFSEEAAKFNIEAKVISDQVPHYVDPNDELVKTLHQAYVKYTNDKETEIFTIGGGTYARALTKGVAFGMGFPGRVDVVHQVDEHVYIEDLVKSTAIYAEAIKNLGK